MYFRSHDAPCGLYNSLSTLQASRSASALGRHRICATKSARTLPACPQDSVPMGGWPLSDKDSRLPHLHALEGRAAESSGHSIKRRQALLDVPTFHALPKLPPINIQPSYRAAAIWGGALSARHACVGGSLTGPFSFRVVAPYSCANLAPGATMAEGAFSTAKSSSGGKNRLNLRLSLFVK